MSKDYWDKVEILGKLFASIFIPVGLAAAGFFVNDALQGRAEKEKKFEIAITVLQSSDTASSSLRGWALQVFKDTVNPPKAVIDQLEKSPLPNPARQRAVGIPCGVNRNTGVAFGVIDDNGNCVPR